MLQRLRDAFVGLRTERASASAQRRAALADGHLLQTPNVRADQTELTETLQECTNLLVGWGIELKDPERGLIDFYTEQGEEIVFLCYQLGEQELAYWHHLDAGFAGRKRLKP